jgi:hypothetical protein
MLAAISCGLAVFHLYFPVINLLLIIFYMIYAALLFFCKRWRTGLDYKIQSSEPDRKYAGYKALDRENKRVFWIADHQWSIAY